MAIPVCSVEGCDRSPTSRGAHLCSMHYQRRRRRGTTDAVSPEERFWQKVDKSGGPDGCWVWTASTRTGYGRVQFDGRTQQAHRVAYELLAGPIPAGLHLDHLCRVHKCVNPAHLEPVTCRENLLRGVGFTAQRASQTHCMRGHAFDGENTYQAPGDNRRYCRTCRRQYNAKDPSDANDLYFAAGGVHVKCRGLL